MTVFRNVGLWDSSNVDYSGGRIWAYDKKNPTSRMQYIDYGLGVFHDSAFAATVDNQPHDLADLYRDLLARGALAGLEMKERFYEIGSAAGLREFVGLSSWTNRLGCLRINFTQQYLAEASTIIDLLDQAAIENVVTLLVKTRTSGGRLFILGVGGSAANASHAVNDFRKIAGIEAYAPTDNVSEVTARTNDEGWANVFESWLRGSRLRAEDLVLVLSVGGGSVEAQVSPNLVAALDYARTVGSSIIGIVGRDGGHTALVADGCVIVPTVSQAHVTPHTESFQAVIWHLLVSHPSLKVAETKWERLR